MHIRTNLPEYQYPVISAVCRVVMRIVGGIE